MKFSARPALLSFLLLVALALADGSFQAEIYSTWLSMVSIEECFLRVFPRPERPVTGRLWRSLALALVTAAEPMLDLRLSNNSCAWSSMAVAVSF